MKTHLVTRFAPSPTGRLHIGHAYSALFGYKLARDSEGVFILRIEDIDEGRCRPEFELGIYEDLRWLGLEWQTPVRRQSEYMEDYKAALYKLTQMDLLYPCFCTRKEIQDEIARAASAPHGPEGILYPGTCRHLKEDEQAARMQAGKAYAFRLDLGKAIALLTSKGKWPLVWHDAEKGEQRATPEILGDVVLARKDVSASYHLSVTVDDHLQGVTMVTRGEDLFYASHLHRLLQELLGLNVPQWHHHKLLLDAEGKRFAKRNNSVTLQHLREVEKKAPFDIMKMMGLMLSFLLLLPLTVMAQDKPTVEDQLAPQVVNTPYKRYVTFSLENDSIGSGTDQNYTNGVRLSYLNINADVPPALERIAAAIPGFAVNETTAIAWSLGQNMYTPADITIRAPQPHDRPWAAFLYGSAEMSTVQDNRMDELELTLGVVGPAAFGEIAQKKVHHFLNADHPRGWSNQLKNEPGVIISWRRRWPAAWNTQMAGLNFSVEPNVNVSAGNIYTYAGTGAVLKITPYDDRFQDPPPFVRPAMPGTGYFDSPENGFSWHLFAGVEGRAVARNIFLDGNSFRDSPSVDKNIFVADLTGGLALTFDRFRMSYSLVYRTREFDNQADNDLFGAVGLTIRY